MSTSEKDFILITAARPGVWMREKFTPGGWGRGLGEFFSRDYKEKMKLMRDVDDRINKWAEEFKQDIKNIKRSFKSGRIVDTAAWFKRLNRKFKKVNEIGSELETAYKGVLEEMESKTEDYETGEMEELHKMLAGKKSSEQYELVAQAGLQDWARSMILKRLDRENRKKRDRAIKEMIGLAERIAGHIQYRIRELAVARAEGDIGSYLNILGAIAIKQQEFESKFLPIYKEHLKPLVDAEEARRKSQTVDEKVEDKVEMPAEVKPEAKPQAALLSEPFNPELEAEVPVARPEVPVARPEAAQIVRPEDEDVEVTEQLSGYVSQPELKQYEMTRTPHLPSAEKQTSPGWESHLYPGGSQPAHLRQSPVSPSTTGERILKDQPAVTKKQLEKLKQQGVSVPVEASEIIAQFIKEADRRDSADMIEINMLVREAFERDMDEGLHPEGTTFDTLPQIDKEKYYFNARRGIDKRFERTELPEIKEYSKKVTRLAQLMFDDDKDKSWEKPGTRQWLRDQKFEELSYYDQERYLKYADIEQNAIDIFEIDQAEHGFYRGEVWETLSPDEREYYRDQSRNVKSVATKVDTDPSPSLEYSEESGPVYDVLDETTEQEDLERAARILFEEDKKKVDATYLDYLGSQPTNVTWEDLSPEHKGRYIARIINPDNIPVQKFDEEPSTTVPRPKMPISKMPTTLESKEQEMVAPEATDIKEEQKEKETSYRKPTGYYFPTKKEIEERKAKGDLPIEGTVESYLTFAQNKAFLHILTKLAKLNDPGVMATFILKYAAKIEDEDLQSSLKLMSIAEGILNG